MIDTTGRETVTIPVTLARETREVEIRPYGSDPTRGSVAPIFAARIGAGTKVHRTGAAAYLDKGEWRISLNACVRNRQARIIGWADAYEGTSAATQQNYYGSI